MQISSRIHPPRRALPVTKRVSDVARARGMVFASYAASARYNELAREVPLREPLNDDRVITIAATLSAQSVV